MKGAYLKFSVLVLLLAGAMPFRAAAQFEEGLDVPYVPTPDVVVQGMLKLADVKAGETVIDLGCGDGRIVVTAAKMGAKGIGYDLNPERLREANENARVAKVTDKVQFIEKNLFEADIKSANVVTLYLLPSVNEKLKPRLLKELKPGTRIVSHSFSMGDWKPVKEQEVDGRRIYLWIVGK
ncbi:MAG: 50S ribosomal protein L11 methyltransferase [Bryobacterales bacterium]|nr:50S ribosomal protein L11 methyltransferase [Bryobacterales bacterium]